MLIVLRDGGQQLVGDLRVDLRMPGSDDFRDADGITRADGEPLQQLPNKANPLGVDMRECDRLDPASLAGEIDAAPVRQARNGQLRNLRQGALVVEGRGQQGGRLGQERYRRPGHLGGGPSVLAFLEQARAVEGGTAAAGEHEEEVLFLCGKLPGLSESHYEASGGIVVGKRHDRICLVGD